MKYSVLSLALSIAVCLGGCGGSEGDSDNQPLPTPTPTPAPSPAPTPAPTPDPSYQLIGNTEVESGASVGLIVLPSGQQGVESIRWQFPDGIAPLSTNTQAIGFNAPVAGNYSLSFDATLTNGSRITDTITIVVDTTATQVVARLTHQATEGGRVSLRVDSLIDKTVKAVEWTQVSGPAPSNIAFDSNTTTSQNIYFTAPRVSADTVLTYEARVVFDDDSEDTETVSVLVKDAPINDNGFFTRNGMIVTTQMRPYRENSPYATALQQCVYNNQISSSCRFSTLPLIGQVTETPTIDDILDRTLVSHPWMGDAFRDFLLNSSTRDDMLALLRATTAVVISYDIRPSFYWVATGAIYLDANNFWRTPEERDTLNTRPDFRSNFGNDLSFVTTWRYVRDGQYFFPQPGLNPALRRSRDLDQLEAALAWLMYHELAHANDFFNYTTWSRVQGTDSPVSFFNTNTPQSDALDNSLPLTSTALHALAQVRYGGATATTQQRNTQADEVANLFDEDAAISFYSYFTQQEDFASLVERFMMQYRLGVAADIGVFRREDIDNQSFRMEWGQRYRYAEPQLIPRVALAVESVLPTLNVRQITATLPQPLYFARGADWFDVVTLEQPAANNAPNSVEKVTLFDEHRELRVPLQLPESSGRE